MATKTNSSTLRFDGMAPLLQVYDMPESLQFYRDILGFVVTSSSGVGDDVDWVLLKFGNTELMLNTLYEKDRRPPQRDINRQSVHEDVTLYFGCQEVDNAYEYLISKNVNLEKPKITGYNWKAIDLKDPDGYGLCFQWPVDDTATPGT